MQRSVYFINPTRLQERAHAGKNAYKRALHLTYYNFVRMHKKFRRTPTMAADPTERLWEVSDIVALVDAEEAAQAKKVRGR